MITCGIDEAGYGPKLGPLVIGIAAFSEEENKLEEILRKCQIRIEDSKKIYSPKKGLSRLEQAVLSFLGQESIKQVIINKTGLPNIPIPVSRINIDPANMLNLPAFKIRAIVLQPPEFNHEVETKNKQDLVFSLFCKAVKHVINAFPDQQYTFNCGKLSFRRFYKTGLEEAFSCQMSAVTESHEVSHYMTNDRKIEIKFLLDAEDKSRPVALASMIAKYLRELYMIDFNKTWAHPHKIKPTSGYGTDANRFIAQLKNIKGHGTNEIIRTR